MQKETEIRESFGLTQEEMGWITGVSRSLWAMYETGQMSLPAPVKVLQLTQAMQKQREHSEGHAKKPQTPSYEKNQLMRELGDDQHKLYGLHKEIAVVQRKLIFQHNRRETGKLLEGMVGKQTLNDKLCQIVIDRAARVDDEKLLEVLFRLEFKRDKLEAGIGFLERLLKRFGE